MLDAIIFGGLVLLFEIYHDDLPEEEPRHEQEVAQTRTMYGVVLGLPDESSEEVEAKRHMYSPQAAKSIFPHITLRAPFTVEDPRRLTPVLEDIVLKYMPVDIKLNGVGAFKGDRNNVIYAQVENNERLFRLHEALVRGLAEVSVEDIFPDAMDHQLENWVPHVTIADGLTLEGLERVHEELRDYNPSQSWEARELLLVRSESSADGSLLWTTTRAFRAPA